MKVRYHYIMGAVTGRVIADANRARVGLVARVGWVTLVALVGWVTLVGLSGCHLLFGTWDLIDAAPHDASAIDAPTREGPASDQHDLDLLRSDVQPADRAGRDDGSSAVDAADAGSAMDTAGAVDAADAAAADRGSPTDAMTRSDLLTAPEAASPCTPQTCPGGCCDEQGECVDPPDINRCGTSGSSCVDCAGRYRARVDGCFEGACSCGESGLQCDEDLNCPSGLCCLPPPCFLECPHGYALGDDSCEICACASAPCNPDACRPGTHCCLDNSCSADCDGDGHDAEEVDGDDCDDECGSCYPGSELYTSSPDHFDQDCAHGPDDLAPITTATCFHFSTGELGYLAVPAGEEIETMYDIYCIDFCGNSTIPSLLLTEDFCRGEPLQCNGMPWCDELCSPVSTGCSASWATAVCVCMGYF